MQSTQAVHTVLQKLVIRQERDSDKVLKNRQKTAFAPNYVHSLDSTHMMLTALACKEEGVTCLVGKPRNQASSLRMQSL